MNELEVRKTFRWLSHRNPVELRCIKPLPGGKSQCIFDGMAKDEEEFVRLCTKLDGKGNVYLGLRERRAGFTPAKGNSAKKADISAINSLCIDVDAARQGFEKEAATDDELKATLEFGEYIRPWYVQRDFKSPLRGMSGNGTQLYSAVPYTIIDDTNRDIIETGLKLFEEEVRNAIPQHPQGKVKIDSIYDLTRIIKVIGTKSVKGTPTQDRPHRESYWIDEPIREEDENLLNYIIELGRKELAPLTASLSPQGTQVSVTTTSQKSTQKPTPQSVPKSVQVPPASAYLKPRQHLPEVFIPFLNNDEMIKKLWHSQRKSDVSAVDYALMRACLKRGIYDQTDLTTILALRPFGKYRRDKKVSYLTNTVQKALKKFKPATPSLEASEAKKEIMQAINEFIQNPGCYLLKCTPGTSKTSTAIEIASELNDTCFLFISSTKSRAKDVYDDLKSKCAETPPLENAICKPKPKAQMALPIPQVKEEASEEVGLIVGRSEKNCPFYHEAIEPLSRKGYSPGKVFCPRCQFHPSFGNPCPYYSQFEEKHRVISTTYESGYELMSAKKRAFNPQYIIVDEDPERLFLIKRELSSSDCLVEDSIQAPSLKKAGEVLRKVLFEAESSVGSKRKRKVFRDSEVKKLWEEASLASGFTDDDRVRAMIEIANISEHAISFSSKIIPLLPPSTLEILLGGIVKASPEVVIVVKGVEAHFVVRKKRLFPICNILALDAYGNKDDYELYFNRPFKEIVILAKSYAKVIQIPRNSSKRAFAKNPIALYKVLRETLSIVGTDKKILVCTFLEQEEKVKEMFPFIEVTHFWGGRGKDCWRDCEVVILFGTPEPNPNELLDDARFIYDDITIEATPDDFNPRLYKDARLQRQREKKREDEMLQVIHRIRPVWGKGKGKMIFIISQISIPSLPLNTAYDPEELPYVSRKKSLRRVIELSKSKFNFFHDAIAIEAGLLRSQTGQSVLPHRYKDNIITQGTEATPRAVSVVYNQKSKAYYEDRDKAMRALGMEKKEVSVFWRGVWKTFHFFGDVLSFLAAILQKLRQMEGELRVSLQPLLHWGRFLDTPETEDALLVLTDFFSEKLK